MVPGEVPDGGSLSLADLVDDYGEAIDFDMRRFCGIDLHEYLTGVRPVSEGLRRIGYFPPESATVAALRASPPESSQDSPVEPWRGLYGQGPVYDVLADLWDLHASKGTPKGKKAPHHPRGAPQRPRRRRRPPSRPTP